MCEFVDSFSSERKQENEEKEKKIIVGRQTATQIEMLPL